MTQKLRYNVVLTDRKNQKIKPSSTKGFTPFKIGGKSATSENFDKVRHVRVHVWSSRGKAADPSSLSLAGPQFLVLRACLLETEIQAPEEEAVTSQFGLMIAQTHYPADSWVCLRTRFTSIHRN